MGGDFWVFYAINVKHIHIKMKNGMNSQIYLLLSHKSNPRLDHLSKRHFLKAAKIVSGIFHNVSISNKKCRVHSSKHIFLVIASIAFW